MLNNRQVERIIKGVANHRRVAILNLLHTDPELSLSEISENLKINLKTASEHIRKLTIAGLVLKRSQNKNVRHKLSERGVVIIEFLRTLE